VASLLEVASLLLDRRDPAGFCRSVRKSLLTAPILDWTSISFPWLAAIFVFQYSISSRRERSTGVRCLKRFLTGALS
jgi:hypothetical protein